MKDYPTILGIETSCDETAASIIKNNFIISNIVSSQKIHEIYGGVVPELASRLHEKNILTVVNSAISKANIIQKDIDAIAFTIGPGLIGPLMVGCSFAKSLSLSLNVPLIAVDHIQAHVLTNFIKDNYHKKPKFPYLCLMISGGNTQIIRIDDYFNMTVLGKTIDNALGETLDKLAKLLGFKYPGGHMIDKYAKKGLNKFFFTKPKLNNLDFSFSGFKTNVSYFIKKKLISNPDFITKNIYDICASIQKSIIDILIDKLKKSIKKTKIYRISLAGGVSANTYIRKEIKNISLKEKWELYMPKIDYCGDNAAMIAMLGTLKYRKNMFDSLNITPYTKKYI